MRTKASLKFRIKVEEKRNGEKIYYPQASYSRIGIKRDWFGIGLDISIFEEFDLNKNYSLERRNMGFSDKKIAEYIIEKWKSELESEINTRTKKVTYLKY